jgi:hypothetical protein
VEERLGHCDIIEEKEEWAGTGGMAAVSIIRLEAARPPPFTDHSAPGVATYGVQ